ESEDKKIYLSNLAEIQRRFVDLSETLRENSLEHDMARVANLINEIGTMIQTLQGSAFPFNYAIPDSLLKWLDKPDVNNPDEYLNQCLEMCENYNRAYQQRRDATHCLIQKLETDLA
ncbi:hypothetical protein WA538_000500, partial [Blastocystis sp. DL]